MTDKNENDKVPSYELPVLIKSQFIIRIPSQIEIDLTRFRYVENPNENAKILNGKLML